MTSKIEQFKTYSTDLGKQLFPNHDFHSMRAQTRFSEAWNEYGKDIDSIEDFKTFLEHFTPEQVRSSINNPDQFTKSTVGDWGVDKRMIANRLEEHYAAKTKT